MTADKDDRKDLLMVGTIYQVPKEQAGDKPTLHYFPGSLNSQKAHACIRFSSLDDDEVDFGIINYPEDNQTIEYARLNPNMSIPVLQIDDKIITDSREIQKYLTETYPSAGDAAVEKDPAAMKKMNDFIDSVIAWDEYLFSYRGLPSFPGKAIHNIRLVWLSDAVWTAETQGLWEEKLRSGQTLRQAYVKKVAQVRALIDTGCDAETPELHKRIEANAKLLEDVFQRASDLMKGNSDDETASKLLMGDNLTSADAYFATVVARVAGIDAELLETHFKTYPRCKAWWEHFQTLPEAQCIAEDNNKLITMGQLLKTGKLWKFLGYAVGWYVPKPLPEDFEAEVQKELELLEKNYLE